MTYYLLFCLCKSIQLISLTLSNKEKKMNPESTIQPVIENNAVTTLQNDFNRLTEAFNQLVLLRQHEMPDDLVTEAYAELVSSMRVLMQDTTSQQDSHIRDVRSRARAERIRNQRRQQRAVIPAPPPPPVLPLTLVDPSLVPIETPVVPMIVVAHTPEGPPPALELPLTLVDPSLVPIETPVVPMIVVAHTPEGPPPALELPQTPEGPPPVARVRVRVPLNANPAHNRARANAERLREAARPFHISSGCLTKKEQATPMPDVCGICLDGYTAIDSVRTNCGHTFCKTCFNQHETTGLNRAQPRVDCPFCRTLVNTVFENRARKTPVRRATPVRRPKQVVEAPIEAPSTIIINTGV